MLVNREVRKPGEGIWWRTSRYKNIPNYDSDISMPNTKTIRFVSKAEKEAWMRALSTSFSEAISPKTPVMRTVSKAEKEAWEKVACEALINAFMVEMRPKLYEYLAEMVNKWIEER